MAVKSVLLLEVILALILLVSQDVAYARDINSANGGPGLTNGGGFENPDGINGGYGQPIYVVIYGDGQSRVFGPESGGGFGTGFNDGFGQPLNGDAGGFGTGFNGGFGQPSNNGVSGQIGLAGGQGN